MTWEELLTTKGYVYIGQCCGGWSKYTPKANLNERGRVIDAMKIIRTRRDKFKIPANRGYSYRFLRELEDYLNAIG